jgi:ATP-dependent helicase YprA (DUF1998 family)
VAPVIIATTAFDAGVDVSSVSASIFYGVPYLVKDHAQLSGWAGRHRVSDTDGHADR